MKRRFKNRENKLISYEGKDIWLSRSVAVVGVHLAEFHDKLYALVEKRSQDMDCPGKWAVISGYLDWDESAYDAVIRETYEETGFDVLSQINKNNLVHNNDREPIKVNSDPTRDARQNVTLIYLFIYNFDKIGLPLDVEEFKSAEVDDVMWLDTDLLNDGGFFDNPDIWAFHHDDVISDAIGEYNKTFY